MTPGARIQATIDILDQIGLAKNPTDTIVDTYFRKRRYAGSSDRRSITSRVYNILRRRAHLDWWIERTGGFSEPDSRARVLSDMALDEKVSPEQAAQLFTGGTHCPATLSEGELALAQNLYGRPLGHADMPVDVRMEFPQWMEASLRELWGDQLETEMAALNQQAPVDLRVNTLKSSWEQVMASLEANGLEGEPTALSPIGIRLVGHPRLGGSQALNNGWIEIQDEGSQLVSLLVDARPGMTVIDLCAGAGGKTLAILANMSMGKQISGRLIACDISNNRLDRMDTRLKKAVAHKKDTRFVEKRVLSARSDSWIADHPEMADRVLIDVPCTGTGVWRRDPAARWRFNPDDLDELVIIQQNILEDAATLVKPGGRLIYVTCSLLREENELQIDQFTKNHAQFSLLPTEQVWAETIGGSLPLSTTQLRLSPASTGTDGFFCTVLEKSS